MWAKRLRAAARRSGRCSLGQPVFDGSTSLSTCFAIVVMCTSVGPSARPSEAPESHMFAIGISFDTPEENLAFKQDHDFPFTLLSDPTREVGTRYQVLRDPGDKFVDYPRRISYLIDPEGVIVKSYEVSDPGGHAAAVLADLEAAQR